MKSDPGTDAGLEQLRELTRAAAGLLESNPPEAGRLAEKARGVAERLGVDGHLARNTYTIGASRLAAGEYDAAEAELREALDLAQSLGDRELMVKALRSLLKCNFFTRNPDAALLRGMQALQLSRDLGDRATEAQTHNDLGLVYGRLGDLEGALEHLLAGLRILQEEWSPRLGNLLNNIGNVYLELDDFEESLRFFERSLEELQTEGASRSEAIAYGNICRAQQGLGRFDAAYAAAERSVAIHEQNADAAYLPPSLARLASVAGSLGHSEEAREGFERAVEVLEGSPHKEFGDEVYTQLGRFQLSRGELDAAIENFRYALDFLPDDETSRRAYELHEALALAFEGKRDYRSALHHFKEYHRIRQAVADSATTVRIRGLMLQFDVERARQQEEIFRLRNVELAQANDELHAMHERLEAKNRELHQISIEDALTQLYNRRFLDLQLGVEISRSRRHHRPLCVAMCDIDHFKDVNDRHSHALGDEVLRTIAGLLRETARATDIVARFGGEEFLLILPDTDLPGAETLTERIRAAVAGHDWDALAPGLRITLSIGVACLQDDLDAQGLLSAADSRLYEAKRAGRDRVVA